jgi:hypothetical protein
MVVRPEYPSAPSRVSVPPRMVKPPVPPIVPAKVSVALVNVRVCTPSVTNPVPESETMEAPLVAEMSKMPLTMMLLDAVMLSPPDRAKVPAEMVVRPVYELLPERISVPPVTSKPPVPEMEPEKVPLALVKDSGCEPNLIVPEPEREMIEAPPVVAEMSNVPTSTTLLEAAILPLPDNANVPVEIVVVPV